MEGHTRVQWIHFPGEGVLREKAVFLARKDMHFVPVYQRHCQCLGVHFRTGIVPHGVAVNDQDDLHWGGSPKRYNRFPMIVLITIPHEVRSLQMVVVVGSTVLS